MLWLELLLLGLTVAGLAAGVWSIYWVRGTHHHLKIRAGKCLFVLNLLLLGGMSLFAAWNHAHGLPPLGLVAAWLVVAMLWETPTSAPTPPPQELPS